jgi:hypothetical protein
MASEKVTVPPIPYKVKVTDQAGFVSPTWSKWFRSLFERVGGVVALSNLDLATIQLIDISDLQSDILALQAQNTVLSSQITSQVASAVSDLNQGPVL